MGFPLITSVAVNSVFFGVYGNTVKFLESLRAPSTNHPRISTENKTSNLDLISCATIFLAGCTGGFAICFVQAPADLIKTLLQSQLSTAVSTASARPNATVSTMTHFFTGPKEATLWIYRQQGVFGFYRGFTAMLALNIPTSGLYVIIYECLHHIMMKTRLVL